MDQNVQMPSCHHFRTTLQTDNGIDRINSWCFTCSMPDCIFCQSHVNSARAYHSCEISAGNPCSHCLEYVELEVQIHETRKILERQLIQQRNLRTSINHRHDPLIERVPREITSVIFDLAVSLDGDTFDDARPRKKGASCNALTLGAVSGAWRDMVWSTPLLWATVPVHISGMEVSSARLDIAREWLARSDDLPLSISIRIDPLETQSEQGVRDFIDIFNLHSSRWRDLNIFCPSHLLECFQVSPEGAPMLRRMTLFPTDYVSIYGGGRGYSFRLQGAKPLPESVQIKSYNLNNLEIDWSNVTTFVTDTCWTEDYQEILTWLPNLERWILLDLLKARIRPQAENPSITHDKLQYLHITDSENSTRAQPTVPLFLDSLTLPSLRKLSLNMKQTALLAESVVSLVDRSSCSMTSLSLCDPNNHHNMLINLLRRIPSIEEMEFLTRWRAVGDGIYALLNMLARTTPKTGTNNLGAESQFDFLPNLRHLKYSTSTPNKIPWDIISNMFSTAPSPINIRPFKCLTITRGSRRPDDADYYRDSIVLDKSLPKLTIRRLLNLVDTGVEVYLPKRLTRSELMKLLEA